MKRFNSTFSQILDHLSAVKLKLILIDPHVLKHLFVSQLSFDHLDRQWITFGVIDSSIEKYFPFFKQQGLTIQTSTNIFLDHVFLEYKQKIVHIAILHRHYSFYLIHPNLLPLSNQIELAYGDKLRAIEQ